MKLLTNLVKTLLLLLVAGYLGINFFQRLPPFLVLENIVYSLLYLTCLTILVKKGRVGGVITLAIVSFNAGRVSRSIITPTGELARLALAHVPLLTLLLVLVLLVTILSIRGDR